jgi:ABC-type transport system involved in cytochrome c biogenesis permease subunit
MKFWMLFFFIALFSSFWADEWDCVPVLDKGRFHPVGAVEHEKKETLLLLPPKISLNTKGAEWLPLENLKDSSHNFTLHTDADFYQLKVAYEIADWESLAQTLKSAYRGLEGKIYLKSANQTLKYPTFSQLKIELFLHRIPYVFLLMTGYCGAILLGLYRKLHRAAFCLFIVVFLSHTLFLGLRCYILLRPPVSNMQETIFYVPWISSLACLLMRRYFFLQASMIAVVLLSLISSGCCFENVQAVLNSNYWLTIHVLMVVGSYGLFFLAGVLGHLYLFQNAPSCSLEKKMLQCLYVGTFLLICGTILGGVWAAESWGRFWDWDPKESWAFISSGFYLIAIHAYKYKKIQGTGLA